MKVTAIIPARYGSTRFPGKPLADIAGKSMIRRVYENTLESPLLDEVIVATDDERILRHVEEFGGRAMLTSAHHANGTGRCAEILSRLDPAPDLVLCVQGDEPFVVPAHIRLLVSSFEKPDAQIATLAMAIIDSSDLFSPHVAKVVMTLGGEALYFSRSIIPYLRGVDQQQWFDSGRFYKHIGLYGYRPHVLQELVGLPESELEKSEQLEQLRWLEHGYRIRVEITDVENMAVDTPEDLARLLQKMGKP